VRPPVSSQSTGKNDSSIAHELGGDPADPLAEHVRGDHVVRPPAVADLARAVLGVASGPPVDLVGLDAGNEEAVAVEALHLLVSKDRQNS
jgi:hypothetical protein